MRTPGIILDCLPSLCQSCWKFDEVMTTIILLSFFRHGVGLRLTINNATDNADRSNSSVLLFNSLTQYTA